MQENVPTGKMNRRDECLRKKLARYPDPLSDTQAKLSAAQEIAKQICKKAGLVPIKVRISARVPFAELNGGKHRCLLNPFAMQWLSARELACIVGHEIGHDYIVRIENRRYQGRSLWYKMSTFVAHARRNEYLADRFSARMTGNPDALIRVLKEAKSIAQISCGKMSLWKRVGKHLIGAILHPPVNKRIERLEKLKERLERTGGLAYYKDGVAEALAEG